MPAQSSLSKVVNKRPTESAAKPKRVSARKDLANVVGAGAARADAEHEESSRDRMDIEGVEVEKKTRCSEHKNGRC
jgi:hypothetical protein